MDRHEFVLLILAALYDRLTTLDQTRYGHEAEIDFEQLESCTTTIVELFEILKAGKEPSDPFRPSGSEIEVAERDAIAKLFDRRMVMDAWENTWWGARLKKEVYPEHPLKYLTEDGWGESERKEEKKFRESWDEWHGW